MATVGTATGSCNASKLLTFSSGSLQLLEGTLTGSSGLSGTIAEGATATHPTVCVTGGTVGFPASWHLGSLTLSATDKLCFALASFTGTTPVLGAVTSGSLAKSGIALPFGSPNGTVHYKLVATFTDKSSPTLNVVLEPTATPAGAAYVDATVTVVLAHGAATASGGLHLFNFVLGELSATFTVTAGKSGSLDGSVTFGAIDKTSPDSIVTGLALQSISATLSSKTGLEVTATALLGNVAHPLTVKAHGAYHKGAWSLSVSVTGHTWTPFNSLTIVATFTGTVTITSGGDTFDVEAGTAPTKDGHPTPVVTWAPVAGVHVGIDCVALTYGVKPSCRGGREQSTRPTRSSRWRVNSASAGQRASQSPSTAPSTSSTARCRSGWTPQPRISPSPRPQTSRSR